MAAVAGRRTRHLGIVSASALNRQRMRLTKCIAPELFSLLTLSSSAFAHREDIDETLVFQARLSFSFGIQIT